MADTDASILTEDKKEKGDTETTGRRRSKTASEKKEKKEGDREPKKSKKSKKKGEASKDLESLETPKNTTKEKDFPSIVSPRRRSATDYLLTPTPQKRDTKKVSKKVEKTVITPKKKKKRAVAEVVTEKDSSDLPKPTDVEGTHSEPIKPISEATALSNNHSSPHPPRSMLPIQPPKEDEKDKNKKKGWKFWGKKKGEVQVGGIIAGSVKQEGHAGFDDSGSLRTEGLPPAIAAFFKSLDEMFRKSDQAGLTQQEVVFVLRKYGHLLPTTAPPAPIKLTAEELEERNKKLCEEVNNLNKTISNLTTTNQELNNVLASERQQLQQQIKMNTDLQVEITAMSSGETGDGAGIKKSDALLNLENTFRNRLDELSKKLEEEQKKSADLQVELNAVSSERNTLQARIAELERGNAKASVLLSPFFQHSFFLMFYFRQILVTVNLFLPSRTQKLFHLLILGYHLLLLLLHLPCYQWVHLQLPLLLLVD